MAFRSIAVQHALFATLMWTGTNAYALLPAVEINVAPNPKATFSTPLGNGVVFEARSAEHGLELWWTDGSPELTRRLTDVAAGVGDGVCEPLDKRLFSFEDWVYFFGLTGNQADLWRVNIDGNAELFVPLNMSCPDSINFKVDGEIRPETAELFVIAPAQRTPSDAPEAALWRVSLRSGLAQVPAFPATGWWVAGIDTIWNGNVYVRLFNGTNRYARLDEVNARFEVVIPDPNGVGASGIYGDKLILGGGRLYSTDGTTLGTIALTTQGTIPAGFGVEMNGIYYLPAALFGGNRELWRTDGSLSGTYKVIDFNGGYAGMAGRPFVFDGTLVFYREHYDFSAPSVLYESDGSQSGTRVFVTSNSMTLFRQPSGPTEIHLDSGRMYAYGWKSVPSGASGGPGAIWEVSVQSRVTRQLSQPMYGSFNRLSRVNDYFLLQTDSGSPRLYSVTIPLFAADFE